MAGLRAGHPRLFTAVPEAWIPGPGPGMTGAREYPSRHGRLRAGHPRLCSPAPEGVDPRAGPGDDGREWNTPHVMAGLEPAIHVFSPQCRKAWIPGAGPGDDGREGNTGDDGACK